MCLIIRYFESYIRNIFVSNIHWFPFILLPSIKILHIFFLLQLYFLNIFENSIYFEFICFKYYNIAHNYIYTFGKECEELKILTVNTNCFSISLKTEILKTVQIYIWLKYIINLACILKYIRNKKSITSSFPLTTHILTSESGECQSSLCCSDKSAILRL